MATLFCYLSDIIRLRIYLLLEINNNYYGKITWLKQFLSTIR